MFAIIRAALHHRRRRAAARSSVLLMFGFSFGCVGRGQLRGFPLYPTSGEPLPREQIALLTGDVQVIDGQQVSGVGRWFELLPGCHVVTTSPQWQARVESSASGILPPNGQLTYAMNMKAGHRYEIQPRSRQVRRAEVLVVSALEKDPEGAVTQEFVPAMSETDLEGCQPAATPMQPPEQTLRDGARIDE